MQLSKPSEHKMRIKIRNFGIAREVCGGPVTELDVPENLTAGELKVLIGELFPRLAAIDSLLLAVNAEYSEAGAAIAPTDEIAIIPPVSGG